jgi:predicted RNase H-like nuclease
LFTREWRELTWSPSRIAEAPPIREILGKNDNLPFGWDAVEFIGVDLGWGVSPPSEEGTAVCVMDPEGRVTRIELVTDDDQILSFFKGQEHAWVGIDAPLIVNNQEGLRACERALFDRSIRVLPSSMGYLTRKFGGCRGVVLAEKLSRMGYSFPGSGDKGRLILEVYPYGALQVITGKKVPRYKKGPAGKRRGAALELLRLLRRWMPVEIPLSLDEEINDARPSELKSTMDKIDSVISVLCVYGHWIYSGKRTEILGDTKDGFILLPRGGINDE